MLRKYEQSDIPVLILCYNVHIFEKFLLCFFKCAL
jgi:hypothetical protein